MCSDKLYKWLYKGLKKPSFFHFPEDAELKKKIFTLLIEKNEYAL